MKLHGVFVGIDRYRDGRISSLAWAEADAVRFCSLVEEAFHPGERSTQCLINEVATRARILRTIGVDLAAAAGPDDIIAIHFACHGSPELGSNVDAAARYLIPHDADYANLFGSAIDLERDLRALLQRLSAGVVIVFIDACFSGIAGGRSFEGPKLREARRARRWTPQLPTLRLGAGKIVLTAADDDEVALESSRLGHGLFSSAVFDALTERSTKSCTISVSSLYDVVSQRVSSMTNGAQNPVMNGYTRLARFPYLIPASAV